MVESKNELDEALDFFDQVFLAVPTTHRVISEAYLEEESKPKPSKKEPHLSLAEINERAMAKIEEIRRVNREKSQNKIAELTKQHKLTKEQKQQRMEEDLSESDAEMKDATKKPEKVVHKSKGTLAKSKMENKRKQKEAVKLNKLRRQQGTQA